MLINFVLVIVKPSIRLIFHRKQSQITKIGNKQGKNLTIDAYNII